MAYKTEELFNRAIELIESKKLFFIDDIIALMPITKPTFYDHFKVDSNYLNKIKEKLEINRIEVKSAMRSKWYKSENATLQIALMKLICTDEEAHRLNGSKQELKVNEIPTIVFENISKENSV